MNPRFASKQPSISVQSDYPNHESAKWQRRFRLKSLHEIRCQRDRSSEYSKCHGDEPLQAETTLLRQRYRSSEYSKWHGILAIWILKSVVFALVVVRTSTSRPYRPLGHIYQATTLWPVVIIQPFSVHRTPSLYVTRGFVVSMEVKIKSGEVMHIEVCKCGGMWIRESRG